MRRFHRPSSKRLAPSRHCWKRGPCSCRRPDSKTSASAPGPKVPVPHPFACPGSPRIGLHPWGGYWRKGGKRQSRHYSKKKPPPISGGFSFPDGKKLRSAQVGPFTGIHASLLAFINEQIGRASC